MKPLYHERIPDQAGIYRITCTITGKFYIGSAINLHKRRYEHFASLKRNEHHNPKLQRAFNKYGGDTFIFEVLELILIPDLLTAREQHYLDTLKPFEKRGFNICKAAGSTLGRECTPEARQKIGDANRGKPAHNRGKKPSPEQIEKHRQSMTGYKHTEEAKRNMGESHKGSKRSPETREKMRQTALGHPVSDETRAKIGAKSKGRIFSTEARKKMSTLSQGRTYASRRKTLIVTSPDGTEHTITGIQEFCKEHFLDISSLTRVAQGKYSQHKGYKARYPEES